MKIVSVVMFGTILILAMVSCGGGGSDSGVDPALEPAYQACLVDATDPGGDLGFTGAKAAQFCECYIGELGEVFTAEKLNAMYTDDEGDPGDLATLGILLEKGYECLAK